MSDRSDELACPACHIPFEQGGLDGIRIGVCPQCRSVWIDRENVDYIVARSAPAPARAADPPSGGKAPRPGFGGGYGSGFDQPSKKRRKSFIEELFG